MPVLVGLNAADTAMALAAKSDKEVVDEAMKVGAQGAAAGACTITSVTVKASPCGYARFPCHTCFFLLSLLI